VSGLMPRIMCSVRKFTQDRLFPFVGFSVQATGVSMTVDALIDTGSPLTCLCLRDLAKTRLPISRMRGETFTLAGHKFTRIHIKDAVISLSTETGEPLRVEMPSMNGLVPTKMDRDTIREVSEIPSLMGNDFLEDHRLSL